MGPCKPLSSCECCGALGSPSLLGDDTFGAKHVWASFHVPSMSYDMHTSAACTARRELSTSSVCAASMSASTAESREVATLSAAAPQAVPVTVERLHDTLLVNATCLLRILWSYCTFIL